MTTPVELTSEEKLWSERLVVALPSDSIEQIRDRLTRWANHFTDSKFPAFLSAIHLLLAGREEEGYDLLTQSACPLATALARFRRTAFATTNDLWDDMDAVASWSQSRVATVSHQHELRNLDHFLRNHPLETPTIADVGPGDGNLTAAIVEAIRNTMGWSTLSVILIDESKEALKLSAGTLKLRFGTKVECHQINAPIQTLAHSNGVQLKGVSLIHSASTLHHLRRSEKCHVLQWLIQQTQYLILCELEGNHEIPTSGSPELLYSVYRFYNCLIEDVLLSVQPEEYAEACIERFLLTEVMALLFNDYESRLNYHCLQSEWREHLDSAGGRVLQDAALNYSKACPRVLFFSTEAPSR